MPSETTHSGLSPRLTGGTEWWWQNAGLRKLYFLLCVAILSSATNGYDGSMMNGLQTLSFWQDYFGHPEGGTLGILNAIQSVGGMVSLPYAAILCDRIGRKKTIFVGCCYVGLGAALQAGAQNIGMFIAARFFIGHGSCISAIASPMLITELCHPRQRGKVTAVYNTCWYLGSLFAAWTTFGTLQILSDWSWRLPSLLQVVPSLIQLLLIWFLPDSPRFLISNDRAEEALLVMAKYHANGNTQDESVLFEYTEIQKALDMEKEGDKTSWKSLVATPGNRKRVLICVACGLFSQLSGNGLVSYYLSPILNQLGYTDSRFQNQINGIYATTNWFEAMFAAFMVDRVGRRPLFVSSNTGMVVTFALWIAFTALHIRGGHGEIGIGAIVMLFLHTLVYNFAWTSLNVAYPVEILPYHLRAKGLTILNLSISLALFFGQYVNPIGIKNLGWKFYIVYEVWLVIELVVVIFFFTETRGHTLEEISVLFDGREAVEELKTVAETKMAVMTVEDVSERRD